jgi:hypothetical protein
MEVQPPPAPVVSKAPPQPIEEMPPDQRPDGENVQWIPGYWSWDDERTDYVWVSGFWRVPPPGRQWVPGHWQQVADGWQWTSGLWTTPTVTTVEYVPPPPSPIEAGPSVPAPDADSLYVPGTWVFQDTRFRWRPGFWMAYRPGWIWNPAHYIWTPAGAIFVEGYWDYPLAERGLLFAPIRLARNILLGPRWVYRPRYVVQTDFLIGAMFVRPAVRHYYFGDYFAPTYVQRGFVPWVDYRVGRVAYDPVFSYYRHQFVRDPAWERNLRQYYVARTRGEIPRPPQTLAQQTQVVKTIQGNKTAVAMVSKTVPVTHVQNVTALTPLGQVHTTKVTHLAGLGKTASVAPTVVKVAPVSKEHLVQQQKTAVQIREVGNQWHQSEAKVIAQKTTVKVTEPHKVVKVEMPKHPVPPPVIKTGRTPPPPPHVPKHEERAVPKK